MVLLDVKKGKGAANVHGRLAEVEVVYATALRLLIKDGALAGESKKFPKSHCVKIPTQGEGDPKATRKSDEAPDDDSSGWQDAVKLMGDLDQFS